MEKIEFNMLSYVTVFVIGVVGQMSLLFWMGEIKKCEKKEPRYKDKIKR